MLNKGAATLSLLAVVVNTVATAVTLWLLVLSDYLSRTPADAEMGVYIGFFGTAVPTLVIGGISGVFSGRYRLRLILLNVVFIMPMVWLFLRDILR